MTITHSPITQNQIIHNHLFRESFEPSTPSFRALMTTFERRVKANRNIFFSGVTVLETTRSYYGSIKAIASTLSHVYARINIELLGCSAELVQAQWGKLTWENESPEKKVAKTIQALTNITLQGISCDDVVESKRGDISAVECTLSSVLAYKKVDLESSSANLVVSNTGDIFIKASPQEIKNVHAQNNIDLQDSPVSGITKSVMGKVSASSSTLNIVKAHNDILLINSPANSCYSSEGNLTIETTNNRKIAYTSLSAHSQININNVLVSKVVKSATTSVRAENSQLNEVIGTGHIELINSTAKKVTLIVRKGTNNTLTLTDSTISESISVKLVDQPHHDLLIDLFYESVQTNVRIKQGQIEESFNLNAPHAIELIQSHINKTFLCK